MKKGGFLRNVLDTIRSNPGGQQQGGTGPSNSAGAPGCRGPIDFGGKLQPQHFSISHVARHGFPENPTALAFDPVQKIAAIGTKSGALRVFGRPGIDVWAQHKPEFAVTHIKFIVNQGAIITVTSDESIHLWSLRGPNLKLQLSTNTSSSSPGQSSNTGTATGTLTSQHSVAGSSPIASTTLLTSGSDSGAQPGDPDYLADQLSSSPTIDQSKQYSRQPEILHTLKFQREHITCLHQTLMSKWLYIGTERGNVHVANVETFELSGYSIAWNKAIELSRKTHPGAIIHISECPQDTNKLLIGYESGCIALWDLKSRTAEGRYYYTENLLWLAWHYEGKQFVAAHGDGSLVTWQTRSNARPVKVTQPHAKTAPQCPPEPLNDSSQLTGSQQPSLSSSFARALNNELYRPINKVDWKTYKNNEQFLIFSGGLPYDGLEQNPPVGQQQQSRQSAAPLPLQGSRQMLSAQQTINQQQQQQQFLKSSASPSSLASPSPMSPSISPSSQSATSRQSLNKQQQLLKEKKNLRSTSLTVMYGKSITVLEMDETIIDFITICDNSPYENDTSDPFAVIVLLANDLILIDLTSPGYPSYDSPYPASSLNESPVTCVQYLADCSSDLIPFLYSTSQNVVSRVPKKGFSDKEWPINGGEWGQPMQSYPELVLTGHADGTIKFWDMSGVNFDLISKIKTSKLFERPNLLPNSIVLASGIDQQSAMKRQVEPVVLNMKPNSPDQLSGESPSHPATSTNNESTILLNKQAIGENYFAIEKIEYYPNTKHLIVAGALSQIIQFKLHKKDSSSSTTINEMSVIFVDPPPCQSMLLPNEPASTTNEFNQSLQQQQHSQSRQHLLLKAKSLQGATGSSSGGSSSSTSSNRTRSGFQPELICITPLVTRSYSHDDFDSALNPLTSSTTIAHLCQAPPKVTALAFLETHNILVYSHENGIVLVDITQKCVIMNASLADLSGMGPTTAGASIMTNNRDISVQPFTPAADFENLRLNQNNNFATVADNGTNGSLATHQQKLSRSAFGDGESRDNGTGCITGDNGTSMALGSLNKSVAANDSSSPQSQPVHKTNDSGSREDASCAASVVAAAANNASVVASGVEQQDNNDDDEKNNLEQDIPMAKSRKEQQQDLVVENLRESCSFERCTRPTIENVSPTLSSTPTLAPRARLEQTKSVALPDDMLPVAPPRYKKRQSVPLNNELMLRRREQQQRQLQERLQQLDQLGIKNQPPEEKNCDELERRRIKVKVNDERLECGGSEHDDDDGREIDRLSVDASGGRDMKRSQQEQNPHHHAQPQHHQSQQPQQHPSNGGTISSLFTKLMAPNLSSSLSGQPKSRHTANSMFQRQLSITALNLGASTVAVSRASAAGASGPRLFQRQMTTSQLFGPSSSSSGPSADGTTTNKQRAAGLLNSARAGLEPSQGSSANLNRPSGARRLNESLAYPSGNQPPDEMGQQQQQPKKPAKNKRIISRMLSISAIHTGGLGLGGGSSSNSTTDASSQLSGSHQQLNVGDSAIGGNNYQASEGSILTTVGSGGGDQAPDKIDSSFTRSRSSSASSGAQIDGGQHQLAAGESIQCLCFLDWSQASGGAANLAAAAACAGPTNHKSASSNVAGPGDASQQLAASLAAGNQVALWLGTSQGRVLLVCLEMPENEDNRILQLQSVNAEPIPQAAIKLPGAILCLSTFTCEPNRASPTAPSGGLASQASSSLEGDSASQSNLGGSAAGVGGCGQDSPIDARACHFMAVVSEKQARVYQIPGPPLNGHPSSSPPHSSVAASGAGKQQSSDHLLHSAPAANPNQHHRSASSASPPAAAADSPMARLLANKANCVGRTQLSDSSAALRAQVVQMRQPEESCLASYLATGDILVHSLPKLSLLMEAEFVPASSARIGHSMRFSRHGHALYQPSAEEIAKFTLSAQYKLLINEMTGCLYVTREMPEMPRANFFKSLFSVASSSASKQSDRDELFSSESGKASARGVAKHIPSGSGALDKLKGAVAGGMGHEMRLAREGLDERGEKLSEIEDRTLQMMNQSETYAQTAHQLAQKFKDKKWYQF